MLESTLLRGAKIGGSSSENLCVHEQLKSIAVKRAHCTQKVSLPSHAALPSPEMPQEGRGGQRRCFTQAVWRQSGCSDLPTAVGVLLGWAEPW